MIKNTITRLLTLGLVTASLVGCLNEGTGSSSASNSASSTSSSMEQNLAQQLTGVNNFKISLVDKPKQDLLEVWVDIDRMELVVENKSKKGRIILDKNLGLIDLLKLQNGVSLEVADMELPIGTQVKEIRVILKEHGHWALKSDLSKCDLRTPSAQQSGLKLKLSSSINIESKASYSMVVDFDANQSVVQLGNGDCLLKPVIKIKSLEKEIEDNNTPENDVTILDNTTTEEDIVNVIDSNTTDSSSTTTVDSGNTTTDTSTTNTTIDTTVTNPPNDNGLIYVTDPNTGEQVLFDPATGEYIFDPSQMYVLL